MRKRSPRRSAPRAAGIVTVAAAEAGIATGAAAAVAGTVTTIAADAVVTVVTVVTVEIVEIVEIVVTVEIVAAEAVATALARLLPTSFSRKSGRNSVSSSQGDPESGHPAAIVAYILWSVQADLGSCRKSGVNPRFLPHNRFHSGVVYLD